jgi:HSP20 family molecular chaperone IbpA
MTMKRENTIAQAPAMLPAVDVIEDADGITLRADLPGVSREDLSINVDGETLTIEGQMRLGESARTDGVYAELRHSQFRRSFVLSRELDSSRINAAMRNGVLTLTLPRLEQAKPRRIQVSAD